MGLLWGSVVKNLPVNAGDVGWIPFQEDRSPREGNLATHSSILAWEIPWTKESRRLDFMV